MMPIALVGLGAGAAAALLFASVTSITAVPSGFAALALLLFYLAPLPILIAALGWSHLAGLIAAATATVLVVILAGKLFIAVPVMAISFGAWWLGYLTLLARPATNGGGQGLDWYPVGRLVLWAAVVGTLIVAAFVLGLGTDEQSLQAALRQSHRRWLHDQAITDQAALELLVLAVPPAAGVISTLTNVFNLWLAAWVVKLSGRLTRPWPELSAMAFAPTAAAGLAAAIAGSLLPDLFGILSGVLAASLMMAFAILGFAVLHVVTHGMSGRPFLLGGIYFATFISRGLLLLAMSLLGLAETAFAIRARVARRRGPPNNRT
jgi:hypothetical protein